MSKSIRIIYQKFCDGDSITDEELDIGIEEFKRLDQTLSCMGPVFKLTANEVQRVLSSFEYFKENRKR